MLTVTEKYINLNKMPDNALYESSKDVTIGDLHACVLKLLQFLIIYRIFEMSEQDYLSVVALYKKELTHDYKTALTLQDIGQFKEILNRIKINSGFHIRFLGDMLADRGANDIFILLVLAKLTTSKNKIEIILSNHDLEFITYFLLESNGCIYPAQKPSLIRMCNLINNLIKNDKDSNSEFNGLSTPAKKLRSEITDILINSYFKNLKIASFSLSTINHKPVINLYTHAPIAINDVLALGKAAGLLEKDLEFLTKVEDVTVILDSINEMLVNNIGNAKKLGTLLTRGNKVGDIITSRFLWNRDNIQNDISASFKVNMIHGHTSEGVSYGENYFNLDTNVGRNLKEFSTGVLYIAVLSPNSLVAGKQQSSSLLDNFFGLFANSMNAKPIKVGHVKSFEHSKIIGESETENEQLVKISLKNLCEKANNNLSVENCGAVIVLAEHCYKLINEVYGKKFFDQDKLNAFIRQLESGMYIVVDKCLRAKELSENMQNVIFNVFNFFAKYKNCNTQRLVDLITHSVLDDNDKARKKTNSQKMVHLFEKCKLDKSSYSALTLSSNEVAIAQHSTLSAQAAVSQKKLDNKLLEELKDKLKQKREEVNNKTKLAI